MKRIHALMIVCCLPAILSSCEFKCSVGNKDEEPKGTAVDKEGTKIYNSIKLNTSRVKVKRAYLEFSDRTRVPDDNFVDFTQPIKLFLIIDSGWVEQDGQVFLGASEKIIVETGDIILDEADLFGSDTDGISAADARVIALTASLQLRKNIPPTSFSVQFRVWDKRGDGYIEGSYMLFSK